MHKSLVASLFLSGTLLFAATGHAQNGSFAPRRSQTFAGSAAQPLASASQGGLASQISSFLAQRGVFVPASSIVVASTSRSTNGQLIYRLEQQVGGLRVYGVSAKAAAAANGDLVFLTQNFAAVSGTPQGAAGNEGQALRAALNGIYPGQAIGVGAERREANSVVFERTPFFHASPRVTHVLFQDEDGSLNRGLLVETWSQRANLLHETLVGGGNSVLDVVSRTATDSYNVFVEDPLKAGQVVVAGPGAGNVQSPSGWLSGAQANTHIVGNNTDTYLDADNNNAADAGGTAVSTGSFTTAVDLGVAPSTAGNRAVAVQNLFYLTNVMHDDLYAYGFTEGTGNFQTNNFGKGGSGNDPVLAEAQDGGGTDNANFATPKDGSKPRMQMYLWTGNGPTHEVVTSAGTYPGAGADFGGTLSTTGVTAPLAVMAPADGCTAATASLTGRIAIITRGSCNFDVKVKNAQSAGAVAAIVTNQLGDDYFTMGAGTARRVTIPAVMVGLSSGNALRTQVGASATERKKADQPLQLDGSIDSDIVYHEYGHGLTWRMIGGMSGILAGAVGEGASDVNAFLLNGDDRIGEYAYSNPLGIRRFPYEGYPNTYSDVGNGDGTYEVHSDGEIYAAAMWRLMDLWKGPGSRRPVETLRGYWVDGMNFTPATPAFEDMRDGLLQAIPDANTEEECLVWEAFAQFGIGEGANGAVSRRGAVTITESFTAPAACK